MKLHIYNIYLKKDAINPVESVKVVREGGFHLWAAILHFGWSLYHKMWILSIILFTMMAAMAYLGTINIIAYEAVMFMRIGFFAWVGFTANDWIAQKLEKDGYVLTDILSAQSVSEAQSKFTQNCVAQ